jgi:hypothetical protein
MRWMLSFELRLMGNCNKPDCAASALALSSNAAKMVARDLII